MQDMIDRECHDGTVVEKGNDQDHGQQEVELEGERENGEADKDPDGDGAGVDDGVSHTLEELQLV